MKRPYFVAILNNLVTRDQGARGGGGGGRSPPPPTPPPPPPPLPCSVVRRRQPPLPSFAKMLSQRQGMPPRGQEQAVARLRLPLAPPS